MKIFTRFAILSLFIISSCSHTQKEDTETTSALFHLTDSTQIIVSLLQTNKLHTILEDHDPKQLNTLIFNISPALMAFESEVLSCTLPVIVYFYSQEDMKHPKLVTILEKIGEQYHDRIKIVCVEVDKLFSVAQQAVIEKTPTVMLINDRNEIKRLENNIDKNSLYELIKKAPKSGGN